MKNTITKQEITKLNASQNIFLYSDDGKGELMAILINEIAIDNNESAYADMLATLNSDGSDENLLTTKNERSGLMEYYSPNAPKVITSLESDVSHIQAELDRLKLSNDQVAEVSVEILDENYGDGDQAKELCVTMALFKNHGAKEENLNWNAKEAFEAILEKYGWTGEILEASHGDGIYIYRETIDKVVISMSEKQQLNIELGKKFDIDANIIVFAEDMDNEVFETCLDVNIHYQNREEEIELNRVKEYIESLGIKILNDEVQLVDGLENHHMTINLLVLKP